MTHGAFTQAVMKEWGVAPIELRQTCCCQWYLYSVLVNPFWRADECVEQS